MEVEFSTIQLPKDADIRIDVSIAARLGITAQTAQRKVSKLLLEQVGNLLYGETPILVAGERLLWRVPVWISSPKKGALGQVSAIDVDAQTGEILYSQQLLDTISEQARYFA